MVDNTNIPSRLAGRSLERFLSLISRPSETECWEWLGYKTLAGYGQYGFFKKGVSTPLAHRLMYELEIGPIPLGWHIHHKCENRRCVNPRHLEAISPENHIRHHGRNWAAAGKYLQEECFRGHKFTEENSLFKPDGRRRCKICTDLRAAVYAEAKKIQRHEARKERSENRQFCDKGHDLSNAILRVSPKTGNTIKVCRECALQAVKRYQRTPKGREAKRRAKLKAKSLDKPLI